MRLLSTSIRFPKHIGRFLASFIFLISIAGTHPVAAQAGIIWTAQTISPGDNQWLSVTYGNGMYVAVASTGTGNRVMTSPDGITWTARASAADNNWILLLTVMDYLWR